MKQIGSRHALLIVGLVGSLTFIYFQVQLLNSAHLQERVRVLQKLSQWETTLNKDILRVQVGFLSHYDTLGTSMTQLWEGYHILAQGPFSLATLGPPEFGVQLESYQHQLQKLEKLLEQFKTQHSTLRNSLIVFPLAMNHLLSVMKQEDSSLLARVQVDQLYKQMLLYRHRPDISQRNSLIGLWQKLKEQQGNESKKVQAQMNEVIAHGAIILSHQDKVNVLAEKLLMKGSEETLQSLTSTYEIYMKRLGQVRERYLLGMFLVGIFLVGYIVYLMSRLQFSAQSLDRTNSDLEKRVGERTEKLASVVKVLESEVDERKKTEAQLADARDKALAAVEAKSAFLATMSHEIRTPMNGVIGMTGLLLETPLNSEQQHYAGIVRSSGEILLAIINDILDFSKIESGKLDFEFIDFDLRVALEETLELLSEKASTKNLELVGWVFADVPTAVQGDPGRIRQVLMNLIGNAIKFSEKGGVTVQAWRIAEYDQDVLVRFQVEDKGIGIHAETLERLFSPFSQADSSTTRRFGGTGLGLAICKQLVEKMGGELGVESALGQGSLFWFTVKLRKQANPIQRDSRSNVSLHGLRVCCIDDHPINRLLMMQYCMDWGMEGAEAATPTEALNLLQVARNRGNPFDLAIVDMEMPEMDGITLAKKIKANPSIVGTKLVLVTSLGRRGDASLAKEAGFSGYFTKPVKKSQLQSCLECVVESGDEGEWHESFLSQHTISERETSIGARLLVADDHMINQQLAVLMLEQMGHRVDVVANGLEAVEALSRKSYDAILMDCQMPEMDGYEATIKIRKQELEGNALVSGRTQTEERHNHDSKCAPSRSGVAPRPNPSHIPIIAMTANAMPGDREKCLIAGMDDYLSKPIKKEELREILSRWLPLNTQEIEKSLIPLESKHPRMVQPWALGAENPTAGTENVDQKVFAEWKEMTGVGYPDFLLKMAKQFAQDAAQCIQEIQQAIDANDMKKLAEVAHGLKGISRNVGAENLAGLSWELEEQGRNNQNEGNQEMGQKLSVLFHHVQTELNQEIKKQALSPHPLADVGTNEVLPTPLKP